MKKRVGFGFVLMLSACATWAAGPAAVRKQAEGSMLITGTILIETDGSVSRLEVDQRDKLPPAVAKLVEGSGPSWKFEPVLIDNVPRRAKARMSLLVVARKLETGSYEIAIRSGHFGEEAMTPEERQKQPDSIKGLRLKPPSYPRFAAERGVQGTVYVVVKIGRQGTVEEAIAEQVNLRFVASEVEMTRMRDLLANSAIKGAQNWTFQPPKTGESASAEFWSVRVPVDYSFMGTRELKYGQWQTYIPGPRQEIPWDKELGLGESPDAMVAGEVYEVGKGLRLLTPLQSG